MSRPVTTLGRAGLLAAVLLSGCDDAPVREEIELHLLVDGAVLARVRTLFAADDGGNRVFGAEVRAAREAALSGSDPWSQRFAAITPIADRTLWERHGGQLAGMRHEALVDATELSELFRDTPLGVRLVRGDDGTAELVIDAGPPVGVGRRDAQRFERAFGGFAHAVAEHVRAVTALYEELLRRPDRQERLLAAVFETGVDEADPLGEAEQRLVDRLAASDEVLLAALAVPPGEARSLDALARLIFDPFPGPLTVALPSMPVGEVEGFRCLDADCLLLRAQGRGLWAAFAEIGERWVVPDPLQVALEAASGGQPVDIAAFRARDLRVLAPAPSADEVEAAMRLALEPPPRLTVRYRVDSDAEPDVAKTVWPPL